MCKHMWKFSENLDLGKRVLPPLTVMQIVLLPSIKNGSRRLYENKGVQMGPLLVLVCPYLPSSQVQYW